MGHFGWASQARECEDLRKKTPVRRAAMRPQAVRLGIVGGSDAAVAGGGGGSHDQGYWAEAVVGRREAYNLCRYGD